LRALQATGYARRPVSGNGQDNRAVESPVFQRGGFQGDDSVVGAALGQPDGQLPSCVPPLPSLSRQTVHYPVLILVEDDPDDFLFLKRALWKTGATARVFWAHDASEAMKILTEVESRTLLICMVADVKLPVVNGFELLAQVRARMGCERVRFAFVTGCSDQRTKDRACACGVDGFFVKPALSEGWIEVARALQRLATAPMVALPIAQDTLRPRDRRSH
jgi:PleD family two-component response regulator